jgi:hypothetical protein
MNLMPRNALLPDKSGETMATTLTKIARPTSLKGLSLRWGISTQWIVRQGNSVMWKGETWRRTKDDNGRAEYTLIACDLEQEAREDKP